MVHNVAQHPLHHRHHVDGLCMHMAECVIVSMETCSTLEMGCLKQISDDKWIKRCVNIK